MCNRQQATTLINQKNPVNGKWKVFCAILALLYGDCVFGMDNDKNSWTESKQHTSDQKSPNEKLETQIARLQQQLNHIKQNIKNNHQEMVAIISDLKTYIKEQMEKSNREGPNTLGDVLQELRHDPNEKQKNRPNVTFGGQDPYAHVKDEDEELKNRPNVTFGGQDPYAYVKDEEQKNRPNVTFGGQDPYAYVKDEDEEQKNKPNATFGGQDPYAHVQNKNEKQQNIHSLSDILQSFRKNPNEKQPNKSNVTSGKQNQNAATHPNAESNKFTGFSFGGGSG